MLFGRIAFLVFIMGIMIVPSCGSDSEEVISSQSFSAISYFVMDFREPVKKGYFLNTGSCPMPFMALGVIEIRVSPEIRVVRMPQSIINPYPCDQQTAIDIDKSVIMNKITEALDEIGANGLINIAIDSEVELTKSDCQGHSTEIYHKYIITGTAIKYERQD